MTEKFNSLVVLLLLLSCSVYSKNLNDTALSIKYYDYDIVISTDADGYFTGKLGTYKEGKELFNMDSSFTNYIDHNLIDLDNDGNNELLLYLSEGASPYIFHVLFIFDHNKGASPLFYIQNGELDTSDAGRPLIVVNNRLSPAILGLWYSYYLEYNDGRISYHKPEKWRSAKLAADFEMLDDIFKEVNSNKQDCGDYGYNVFFEYLFLCSKLAGDEVKAEKYFYEKYKCDDKTSALKSFKEYASDNLSWIKDENNYKFTEY